MKKVLSLACLYLSFQVNAQYIQFLGDTTNNAPYVKYLYDDYVLVGTGFSSGTRALNCSDPNNITDVSSVSVNGGTDFIQVSDSIVYSGSWMSHTLSISDFTNINAPITLGNLTNLNGLPCGVAVNGDYFYLSLANDSIYVVDQSNLSTPNIINKVYIGASYCRELAIHDTILYAATANGVKVIDVSDPINPSVVTSLGSDYYEINIDTLTDRLFSSKGNSSGFDVFDISVPSNINLLLSGGIGLTGRGVGYYDNKIFQGTQNGSNNVVAVYDISSTTSVLIDSYPISSGCSGIDVKDSIFYSGDYSRFSVFNLSATGNANTIESYFPAIKVFPNPSHNGIIKIEIKNEGAIFYEVINESGELISSGNLENNQISLDNYHGLFILKLFGEFGLVTKRIIID
ncbi:MAG: T9SS type A sorting domain-containing protein [Crocinitomicaceae bacterium]|nr:T9SS type A sorting domain-containing protein [Crocinitomicaceae bacterium]